MTRVQCARGCTVFVQFLHYKVQKLYSQGWPGRSGDVLAGTLCLTHNLEFINLCFSCLTPARTTHFSFYSEILTTARFTAAAKPFMTPNL